MYVLICYNNTSDISFTNKGLDVRSVFLDIFKAFDKERHDGLIFKLFKIEILGKKHGLTNIQQDFCLNPKNCSVVFNCQHLSWKNININHLPECLKFYPKLFADDISLFLVVSDVGLVENQLYEDLIKINNQAYHWKVNLNLDPSKRAQELIFWQKDNELHISFSWFNVSQTHCQKHLGVILRLRFTFNHYLQKFLLKIEYYIIHKSFVCLHHDYGVVIYEKVYSELFHAKPWLDVS